MATTDAPTITARCHCGASKLALGAAPLTVAYCHCTDCRRWTGAPVAAFGAFDATALMATFGYRPGQMHVPLGIIDQADHLPPQNHCHADTGLPWLHISDDHKKIDGSGRALFSTVKAN